MSEKETIVIGIPLEDIDADEEFNCRGAISPIDVVSLAKDILKRGLLQPVVVYEYTDEQKAARGKLYRLVAGFRRFTAFKVNESSVIPSTVQPWMNEADARFLNLAENIQRKNLNILEEALALKPLHDMGISDYAAADQLGVSRGWCQVRFMLLKLPQEIQIDAAAGYIKQTNIRQLYAILRTAGKESCFESARKVKDATMAGKKIDVNPSRGKRGAKCHRKRSEIFEMMGHIQDRLGNSLATRAMAWCAGEISTQDLYDSIKEYADEMGIDYSIPSE